MKVAAVPWPLPKDALALPARVVTFQTQGGSALSPSTAQFAGVMQGEQAAVPLAYVATGQVVAVKVHVVAPWGL